MRNQPQLQKFQSLLRGRLITPADEDYDKARAVYNGMIDKKPALIAQCVDAADVIAAVNFARDSGMRTAIRGGGHNGPGLGTVEDGLVIDLRRMKGIQVNPVNRTAHVQGGCTWGDVDHATHAFGLVTPSGFISTTGVGGLTLGGGIGYLTRKHGLTIDNLVSVDMVLADGSFVTASAVTHPELFWAVRGGGGNFGVVTSFEFQLHPLSMVYGGPMLWPAERGAELLEIWRDYILSAPEDINGWFAFLTVPPVAPFPDQFHLKKMCAIVWCDTGRADEAEKRFASIRKQFGEPAIDFTGLLPWPALQTLFDALLPSGLQWYWKADFFNDINREAVQLHVKHGTRLPTPLSTMHIYPINGAAHRIDKNGTAFSFRDANFAQVIAGIDPDPANNDKIIAWAREYWQDLHPYSSGGAYINMIMDEGQDMVKAAYRDNYGRLVTIKNKYDSNNLFRINQNISPKG
ncbi:6-hydroxy-D-nicotine oxidase [Aquicella siphonis]|uniref:6-hydroxy-D-nicotine oxidase n=1 Tax=Aquicella siphonis TaxID=254247 RepID=A0A5E4PGT0_9COXI|nr:FAD-binding oxidoreductase [Aquicella siphonis]VVC75566.1 6-hydroxy-D-nicotine oxidase [Aquicella siphonis]